MTGISDFTEKNPSSKVSSFSFGVIGSIKMITITNNSSFAWLILEAGRRKPCLMSARKIRSSLLEMFRKISISENFAKLSEFLFNIVSNPQPAILLKKIPAKEQRFLGIK